MTNEEEIWRKHPEYKEIEVSIFGRVRTLDKVGSRKNGTYSKKGHVLNQSNSTNGYMQVNIPIDGKRITKRVHRLVAETFIPNPDNLPMVNHKDCNRTNNNVENLEFCTASYNQQYREKFGKSRGVPVFAVNLKTLEVSNFQSQAEASRELGIQQSNISAVIKGRQKQTHGYWFKEDDNNGIKTDKDKLKGIVDGMPFRGGVFAVNLITSKVSRFKSHREAGRVFGVSQGNINKVIKGMLKQTGGYWFVNDDKNADDAISRKLQEIKKTKLVLYR